MTTQEQEERMAKRAPTIDGEALMVASGHDWQVWVVDGKAWLKTPHFGSAPYDPTQRVSLAVGDALAAMALALAEMHDRVAAAGIRSFGSMFNVSGHAEGLSATASLTSMDEVQGWLDTLFHAEATP